MFKLIIIPSSTRRIPLYFEKKDVTLIISNQKDINVYLKLNF